MQKPVTTQAAFVPCLWLAKYDVKSKNKGDKLLGLLNNCPEYWFLSWSVVGFAASILPDKPVLISF
jgi:hypothetical protein